MRKLATEWFLEQLKPYLQVEESKVDELFKRARQREKENIFTTYIDAFSACRYNEKYEPFEYCKKIYGLQTNSNHELSEDIKNQIKEISQLWQSLNK